jgi:ABC-type transport system involved in multi-copper enzyme maturation permease subunit
MRGLLRAEGIRLRGRRSLQVIVLALPLLAAFFFLAGYQSSVSYIPTFDEQAYRQQFLIDSGIQGVPPEEAEQMLNDVIASERANFEQMRIQQEQIWSTYAFPQSLLTVLGSSTYIFFAMILITATTIGDEFGWGTIRTTLLASSDRRRLLFIRLGSLATIAVGLFVILLLLGVLLPLVLTATGAHLPNPPPIDARAFGVLLAGDVLIAMTLIGFAALATLLVRSGSLTLVVALVYVAIEAAILALLLRFEAFQPDGAYEWLPKVFPVRGIVAILDSATSAAGSLGRFPGEVLTRDLGGVWLPLGAVVAWGAVFTALAFRRFSRMDIVE